MKFIPLNQGKYAIVDNEDFDWLSVWRWSACGNGTAFRRVHWDNSKKCYAIYMHRQIMGVLHLTNDRSKSVDHINGNGLDNRKENLRICTHQQNLCNQKKQSVPGLTSKFKGVCFTRSGWQVRINCNHKVYYLGRYKKEIDAARAYNEKAKELHGEFARLNPV